MTKKLYGLAVTSLLCVALLSGCGRKGGLEPPPLVSASTTGESVTDENSTPEDVQQPDRPFILDRLIK